MKKFIRSKLFITVICISLAAVLALGVLPKLYSVKSQTTTVARLTKDAGEGDEITSDMLTTKEVGTYGDVPGYITDGASLVGTYATRDISTRENLYADMFTANIDEVDGAMDQTLKEGQKLITVTLGSGAASVGGAIKPGSVVDVVTENLNSAASTDEYGTPTESIIRMQGTKELKNVTVYKVLNANLQDITTLHRQYDLTIENAGDGTTKDSDSTTISNMVPVYVTLIVTDEQAVSLSTQEYSGKVHLVLHPNIKTDTAPSEKDKTDNSASKPTPKKESTQASDKSITLAEYNQIKAGMTYNDVKVIVGCEGTQASPVTVKGVTTIVYTWTGEAQGSTASVAFVDDAVTDMTQTGLV